MKLIAKLEGVPDAQTEDGGRARILTLDDEDVPRLFVRIQSWADDGEHPEIDQIEGSKLVVFVYRKGPDMDDETKPDSSLGDAVFMEAVYQAHRTWTAKTAFGRRFQKPDSMLQRYRFLFGGIYKYAEMLVNIGEIKLT